MANTIHSTIKLVGARMRTLALLLVMLFPAEAITDPPIRPLTAFSIAQAVARDAIYAGAQTTFHCVCDYAPAATQREYVDSQYVSIKLYVARFLVAPHADLWR